MIHIRAMRDADLSLGQRLTRQAGWNQTEAAERFSVPLSTLNQKIKRLTIEIRKKSRE